MKNWIPPDEWAWYVPLDGVRSMLELGDKKNPGDPKAPDDFIYKAFFESLGIAHVSVDWNGRNGALDLDLRKRLWPQLGRFDMVTNIGTTEHVGDTHAEQMACWENIHHCCDVGGVILSYTPYHDMKSWWWHGRWKPTEAFFEQLAARNGYEIERIGIARQRPNEIMAARLRKLEDLPWVAPDEEAIKDCQTLPRNHVP